MSKHINPDDTSSAATLKCLFDTQPGAYERLLRVVRVRGFEIQSMHCEAQDGLASLTLSVRGERCLQNLVAQLTKLCEMRGVDVMGESIPGTRACPAGS